MTKDLITAGTRLAETLETENAALAALDLPRAAGMLADKRSAVAEFDAVRTAPAPSEAAQRMARRLQAPGHGEQAPAGTCDRRAGPGDRRRRAGRDRGDGAGGLWTGAWAPAGTDGILRASLSSYPPQRGRDTAGA